MMMDKKQETSYETSRILNINTTMEQKQLSTNQTTQNKNKKQVKNEKTRFTCFSQKEKFNMNPCHYSIETDFQIVSKL